MTNNGSRIITKIFCVNSNFPNNKNLPLVIFKSPFEKSEINAEHFEKYFSSNGWPAAWRNGIYDFHHYHSRAHEVLGVYSGWVRTCFGGPDGEILEARKGDVIIIPAGVAHCNKGQSPDFMVVGAYPAGQPMDMRYGKPDEQPLADRNISLVSLPTADPVHGPGGPLIELWS